MQCILDVIEIETMGFVYIYMYRLSVLAAILSFIFQNHRLSYNQISIKRATIWFVSREPLSVNGSKARAHNSS